MNNIFLIAGALFYTIPLIAIFDWIIFGNILKNNVMVAVEEYNRTGDIKLSPYSWIPTTFIESLLFIAGLYIGYSIALR